MQENIKTRTITTTITTNKQITKIKKKKLTYINFTEKHVVSCVTLSMGQTLTQRGKERKTDRRTFRHLLRHFYTFIRAFCSLNMSNSTLDKLIKNYH